MEPQTKQSSGATNSGFCSSEEGSEEIINTIGLPALSTWDKRCHGDKLHSQFSDSPSMDPGKTLEDENVSNKYQQESNTLEFGRMFETGRHFSTPDIVICANCDGIERKGHKMSDSGVFQWSSASSSSTDSGVSLRRSLSLGDKPSLAEMALQLGGEKDGGDIWYSGSSCPTTDTQDDDDSDWRPPLEHFTSKRLGSKRKHKDISKSVRSFYKSQDNLIKNYEAVRHDSIYVEDGNEVITALRKKASLYAKITFLANMVLLVIKIVAVVMSGSISLLSSLVDSCVDLMSGVVIYVTSRAVKRTDRYTYPQGRTKLEPMAIVILAVIMSVASLQVIKESITKVVGLGNQSTQPPSMDWVTVTISSATVVVKLVLFLFCRRVDHPTVQALALDHRNDVVSNSAAILFGYIGSSEIQTQTKVWGLVFLDPVGAIIISIYIIVNWVITGWDQIKMLTGHTASPDFLSKITWVCMDHHRHVRKVGKVRAFHYGNNFLVEVEILLPPDMTLKNATDVGHPLQQKLERLPNVERAFVHLDYQTSGE